MNKVMEPFWIAAQGWESLELPSGLQGFLESRVTTLTDQEEDVDHIHVRDFGVRENYLGHGLLFASELFKNFRKTRHKTGLFLFIYH